MIHRGIESEIIRVNTSGTRSQSRTFLNPSSTRLNREYECDRVGRSERECARESERVGVRFHESESDPIQ